MPNNNTINLTIEDLNKVSLEDLRKLSQRGQLLITGFGPQIPRGATTSNQFQGTVTLPNGKMIYGTRGRAEQTIQEFTNFLRKQTFK